MLRRLLFSTAVIAVWFTGGVLLDGCRGVAMPTLQPVGQVIVPTTVPALATAQHSIVTTVAPLLPTQRPVEKAANKSVWLWNNVHLYQLDTLTGTLGERTDEVLGEPVGTQNKERLYFVTAVMNSGTWELSLSDVGLGSTEPVVPITLLEVPRTEKYVYDDATAAKPVLTRDEKTLFVAITVRAKERWITQLVRVNLETGQASQPIAVFDAVAPWGANVNIALSPDERELYLVRTFDTSRGQDSPIKTRVAIVKTEPLELDRVFAVDQEIVGESVWTNVINAPGGNEVYLIESIWKDTGSPAVRFVSLGVEDGRIRVMENLVRYTEDSGCDVRWHLAPTSQELWSWCVTNVQFLDPKTGQISTRLNLRDPLKGPEIAEYTLSQDGKTLYTVYPMSREIVVADLEKREVVKSTILRDRAASHYFQRGLAQLLYGTAEAKIGGRPMMTLSRDEKWLAFTEIKSFDSGDGVWVIDARTLEPIGHWLRGNEISGVRSSFDGTELYVMNVDVDRLQVLNPQTGAVTRTLKVPLKEHSAFLADEQP